MTRGLSKLLALGLLVMTLAVIWFVLVTPLSQWRSESLARLDSAITETMRLTEAKTRLDAESAALGSVQSNNAFWTAGQTGEAYARIQGALSKAASENGIAFRSMTPLPAANRDGMESAVVRIEFEADLAQLTGFLRSIEYTSPALPVDRAALRRLVRPNETSVLPVLFAQIDIAAPLLIGDGT